MMGSGRRIRLVAWHTFKASVRDRALYAIAGFVVVIVAASFLLGQITAGQDLKIIKDLGLAAIELSGVLMAVLIGVGLVSREIEQRTIYSVLAKPIARWEFIIGKYAGLVLTLAVNIAAMTVALFAMLAVMQWLTPLDAQRGWEARAMDPALLISVVLIFAEVALLTALALFFSAFSSSAITSTIFTLGLWVAGLFNAELRGFSKMMLYRAPALLTSAIATVLPAFSAFDVKAQVVHGEHVPAGYVVLTIVYAGVYAAAVLGAAVAVFSRREFK